MFFYRQKFINIDLIDPFIHILQELDRKERTLRSLRGFFLYALEIMETGKDYEFLDTNLKASFWRNLKRILRQNKKEVLLRFLFGTTETKIDIEEKIQILKLGFRLNQEGKISLKKYYESTDPNSLFQLKGYHLKFESVRRTKLYKNFKE